MLASQITEINVRSRQPHPRASSIVDVDLPAGTIQKAELHWYEASGIGKKEFKIKRFVD